MLKGNKLYEFLGVSLVRFERVPVQHLTLPQTV